MSGVSESKERATIELPRDLESRIDRRRREAGFDSIDSYVQFVLEQVLRAVETVDSEGEPVDPSGSDDVRETLRELGYL